MHNITLSQPGPRRHQQAHVTILSESSIPRIVTKDDEIRAHYDSNVLCLPYFQNTTQEAIALGVQTCEGREPDSLRVFVKIKQRVANPRLSYTL